MAFEDFFSIDFFSGLHPALVLLGLFVAAIVANATIFLPLPIDGLVILLASFEPVTKGSILFVVLLGISAGLGAAIGELSGYLVGLVGASAAEKFTKKKLASVEDIHFKLRQYGMPFIFFTALIPFPFDLVGIVAGLIRYNRAKFFVATAAGKTLRYIIEALASFFGVPIILKIMTTEGETLIFPAIIVVAVILTAIYVFRKKKKD